MATVGMRIVVSFILALFVLASYAAHAASCIVMTGEVQNRANDPFAINGAKLTAVWRFSDHPTIEQNDYDALGFHTVRIVADKASLHFADRPQSEKDLLIRTDERISCYIEDHLRVRDWLGNSIREADTLACFPGHTEEEEPYEAWFHLRYPNSHFDQQIAFADEPLKTLDDLGDVSAFKGYRVQVWLHNPGKTQYRVTLLTAVLESDFTDDRLNRVIGAILHLLLE